MPITRGGVYHNLKESKYVTSIGDVSYFFSSKLYQNKFKLELKENREVFASKLNRVVSNLGNDTLADFELYKRIEKRGFRVKINGVEVTWQEMLKYALGKKIKTL